MLRLTELKAEKELTAAELVWLINEIKDEFVDTTYKIKDNGDGCMIKIVNADDKALAMINIKTRRVKIIGYANWYYIEEEH